MQYPFRSSVTGDNQLISRKVRKDVGLVPDPMLLGSDVEKMSDAELADAALKTPLFARLSPTHKERVIRALRSKGHVVGLALIPLVAVTSLAFLALLGGTAAHTGGAGVGRHARHFLGSTRNGGNSRRGSALRYRGMTKLNHKCTHWCPPYW